MQRGEPFVVAGVADVERDTLGRGARVDVTDQQLLAEGGGARDHVTLGVHDDALTVVDEFVLAADQVHVGDRTVRLERALAQHRLSLLAPSPRVRRRVGDDQHRRALARQFGGRTVADPHVLTDQETDGDAAHVDDGVRADAGMEVALFVEDVVVRQQSLGGDRDDAVVAQRDQRVGDMR